MMVECGKCNKKSEDIADFIKFNEDGVLRIECKECFSGIVKKINGGDLND